MTNKPECPKEINGLPVVCTWIEGWQEKMGEFIDKRQDFILLGEKEYLEKVEEAFRQKALKKLIKTILLGGAGATALSGITSASLSIALSLGVFGLTDPEPLSKTVVIGVVIVILGMTAAVLIWELVKLFQDRDNINITFELGYKDFKVLKFQFSAEKTLNSI